MNRTAIDRSLRLSARGVIHLMVAGVITAAVAFVLHPTPFVSILVMAIAFAVVVFVHTYMEAAGKLVIFLPTTGLISGEEEFTEATVEASVIADAGRVEGVVTDTEGHEVGEVIGQLGSFGSIYDKTDRTLKQGEEPDGRTLKEEEPDGPLAEGGTQEEEPA